MRGDRQQDLSHAVIFFSLEFHERCVTCSLMKHFLFLAVLLMPLLPAAEPQLHDVAATKELLAKEAKMLVLDVRTAEEFAEGHLPNAVLVTIGEKDFVERVKKIAASDQPVLVYCAAGGRSARAIKALQEAKFTQLHELKGGMTAWSEQKQPVVRP
jgi:phage shock protein E